MLFAGTTGEFWNTIGSGFAMMGIGLLNLIKTDMKPYRILLREWREKFFDGNKKPSIAKLKKEIDSGNIPGERVGKSNIYYVLCDNNYNPVQQPTETPTIKKTGNPIADRILKNYAAS